MRIAVAALSGFLAACSGQQSDAGPKLDVILAADPAKKLSDYGLFLDEGARKPAERVVAYDLVNPLFSDHSDKHRYIFVPAGETMSYHETKAYEFPVGSVIVKTFSYDDDFVETRLLVNKANGWQAYPYVWNADDTEAIYSPIGADKIIETTAPTGEPLTINYAVPNKNQCKTCHGIDDAVFPIGPKARNLGDHTRAWTEAALLTGMPDVLPAVPHVDDISASVNDRARAYLDINCAHCHRAGASASNSGLWLEWAEESARKIGIQKRPTAAGRASGDLLSVIVPGAPERSIMVRRMASTEAGVAMPELGRSLVHEEGVALIEQWIAEIEAEAE